MIRLALSNCAALACVCSVAASDFNVSRPAFASADRPVPVVLEMVVGEGSGRFAGPATACGFAHLAIAPDGVKEALDWIGGDSGLDGGHVIVYGEGAAGRKALDFAAEDDRVWMTGVRNAGISNSVKTIRRLAPRFLHVSMESASAAELKRERDVVVEAARRWDNPWKLFGLSDAVAFGQGGAEELLAFARQKLEKAGFPVAITDVYAGTSVRTKTLTVETEVVSDRRRSGVISIEVVDSDGRPFKSLKKRVALAPGVNSFRWPVACDEFVPWEVGAPCLYTMRASLDVGTGDRIRYPEFRFGWRELWTQGRDIIMNGHLQRFRPSYSFAVSPAGIAFIASMGFNQLFFCHQSVYMPSSPTENQLEAMDRLGVAAGVPIASLSRIGDAIRKPGSREERLYREWLKRSIRRVRNHPSVTQAYISLIYNGSVEASYPTNVGQRRDRGPQVDNMEVVASAARQLMPGVLLSGFGDCNTLDVASSFCYLNWTPLQEREDWLSQWAEKGTMPIFFPEFGHPYKGNWFVAGKTFAPAEWMAPYFGDRAYLAEDDYQHDMLFDRSVKSGFHGAQLERERYPLWNEFSSLFIRNTTRAWRAWGVSGGMINFCLDHAYGRHPKWSAKKHGGNSTLRGNYSMVDDYVSGRPDWANGDYDNFRAVNRPFLGFIGGAGVPTDKRHAYWSGKEIAKDLVFIWDGLGGKTIRAEWSAELGGRGIASGAITQSLRSGEIAKRGVAFAAPDVAKTVRGTVRVRFSGEGLEDSMDEFGFEVHPRKRPAVTGARPVALLDPKGRTAALFRDLGVPFRLLAPDAPLGDERDLVIGRFALDEANFPFDEGMLSRGLNVLVMPQHPAELKNLGLRLEDRMARIAFLRDRGNPAFAALDDTMLRYWAGAPDYGQPYGNLCEGDTPRFKHWTYRHVIAGVMLRIPEKAGFVPLMDGEFDLDYSPLLEFRYGKGAMTFCTLDLEGREAADPLPWKVGAAVLSAFFAPRRANASGVSGDAALLERMGIRSGGDIRMIIGGEAARKAGLQTERVEFRSVRHPVEDHPLLRGIGPALLRLREKTEIERFTGGDGWTILADGLLAEKGDTVAFAVDPLVLEKKHDAEKDFRGRQATFLSTERQLQFVGRVLLNKGACPSGMTARRLVHQEAQKSYRPIRPYFVLGPFDVGKDDSRLMLDTVFSGEESAIRGDNAPEREYPLPQGGTANWRTTATADEEGVLDFRRIGDRFTSGSFPVNYAIHYLNRETSEPATMEFNCDWRAKVWCNGELVFKTDHGITGGKYTFGIENLHPGRNVLTFKIGSGRSGCLLTARLTPEPKASSVKRREDPELARYGLYELGGGRQWDEYQHRFW